MIKGNCPHCGQRYDNTLQVGGNEFRPTPSPGALALCANCGRLSRFGDEGEPTPLSEDDEWAANQLPSIQAFKKSLFSTARESARLNQVLEELLDGNADFLPKGKRLANVFYDLLSRSIRDVGVFPHLGLAVRGPERTLDVMAMNLADAGLVLRAACNLILEGRHDQVIVAIDRTTEEGQGTTLSDVLTIFYWTRGLGWTYGVMEYQPNPRIVKSVCWTNEWWQNQMASELDDLGPNQDGILMREYDGVHVGGQAVIPVSRARH